MASSPLLIVGLGNPGREYAATRHNIGWMAVDRLASDLGAPEPRKKFHGVYTKTSIEGRDCILLEPETYMNESGQSVEAAVHFYRTDPADMIVVHDELDLGFGDVRLKLGGGHAGHNGLRSIVSHLGTAEFVRVRVGIGRPPAGFSGCMADWVLSPFSASDRAELPDVIAMAVGAVRRVAGVGLAQAMKDTNTRKKAKKQGETGPAAAPEAGSAETSARGERMRYKAAAV
jgi:peptidyl-tRNA hydrolase, PTH1 family